MLFCALAAAALLAYTYVGYPVLIGVLARVRPHRSRAPAAPATAEPMVSAFLPVFHGAAHLRAKLDSLLAQDWPAERLEVLVYCDGCTDGSEALARAIAGEPRAAGRVRVFASSARRGKPAALNALR